MGELNLLNEFLSGFVETGPKVIKALIVALFGWLIAKFIAKAVKRVLQSIGIDKLADKLNEIEIISKANLKFKPSTVLANTFYYFILLMCALLAADVLEVESISELISQILEYMPVLLVAVFVFVIGALLAELIKNVVYTACSSIGIPSAKIISTFAFYFMFVSAIMVALDQARIEASFLKTNLSILIAGGVLAFAIGYGLASKPMVANFLASFYSKNRFKVGDKITIKKHTGKIVRIETNALTIHTGKKYVVIPLHTLTSSTIEIHKSETPPPPPNV